MQKTLQRTVPAPVVFVYFMLGANQSLPNSWLAALCFPRRMLIGYDVPAPCINILNTGPVSPKFQIHLSLESHYILFPPPIRNGSFALSAHILC